MDPTPRRLRGLGSFSSAAPVNPESGLRGGCAALLSALSWSAGSVAAAPSSVLDKLGLKPLNQELHGPERLGRARGCEALVVQIPATVAAVSMVSADGYDRAAAAAQAAFFSWRETPAPRRGELVRDLGSALRDFKEPLGDLVSLEWARFPGAEGTAEVQEIRYLRTSRSACRAALRLHSLRASRPPDDGTVASAGPIRRHHLRLQFPVAVGRGTRPSPRPAATPSIWKPADRAARRRLPVQHIANRLMAVHGVTGVFTLAVGSGRTSADVDDRRLPLLSFTGSTAIGRHVCRAPLRPILELGGNNAILLTADAELHRLPRPHPAHAGQRCTSTRRTIAHTSDAALADRPPPAYSRRPTVDGSTPRR